MPYTPPQEVLERYARVLVDFALGGGKGIEPGDVVRIAAPECARPLYVELNRAVWRSGGHVLGAYQPDEDADANLARDFFEIAGEAQIEHFPSAYMRGLVDEMDHQVSVIATTDPRALDSVEPSLIMRRGEAHAPAARLAR